MTTERRYTMNALHIKNTVLAVLAAAGSAIAQALGGWDVALIFQCLLVGGYAGIAVNHSELSFLS